MELSESFIEWLKGMIWKALCETVDEGYPATAYGADLASTLFETQNVDGTVTYSTHNAIAFVKAHWEDAAEEVSYQKDNYGEMLQNPFENPEAFQVCMLLDGADQLLSDSPFVEAHWNDAFPLNAASAALIGHDLGIDVGRDDDQVEEIRRLFDEDPDAAAALASKLVGD